MTPIPVVNRGTGLGVEYAPVPSAPYISVEESAMGLPAPEGYRQGDRVQIVAWPRHDPYHKNATVEVVHSGPAYGLTIDGMEDMGIHKWYVGQEIRPGPQFREIGPVILLPDVIMALLDAAGVGGSLLIKNPTASMVTLMVGYGGRGPRCAHENDPGRGFGGREGVNLRESNDA